MVGVIAFVGLVVAFAGVLVVSGVDLSLSRRALVGDLLALIGAHDAVLSFEEAEVISATREAANRLTNCDRANLGRASDAAHRQREAIGLLELDDLDPELRRVAELRLAYPDSSMAELSG